MFLLMCLNVSFLDIQSYKKYIGVILPFFHHWYTSANVTFEDTLYFTSSVEPSVNSGLPVPYFGPPLSPLQVPSAECPTASPEITRPDSPQRPLIPFEHLPWAAIPEL